MVKREGGRERDVIRMSDKNLSSLRNSGSLSWTRKWRGRSIWKTNTVSMCSCNQWVTSPSRRVIETTDPSWFLSPWNKYCENCRCFCLCTCMDWNWEFCSLCSVRCFPLWRTVQYSVWNINNTCIIWHKLFNWCNVKLMSDPSLITNELDTSALNMILKNYPLLQPMCYLLSKWNKTKYIFFLLMHHRIQPTNSRYLYRQF